MKGAEINATNNNSHGGNVVQYENKNDKNDENDENDNKGSIFNADSSITTTINQLRQRLVRNSTRYHEDLHLKQECINSSNKEINQLKLHLQECSLALLEAHKLLEQSGQTLPSAISLCVTKFAVYREMQIVNTDV